ncbi:MAG: hypothetical protein M3522_09030 [Actinomycetota bacterium]|nr:hypothetical protein [Actinomycetota bacterium]
MADGDFLDLQGQVLHDEFDSTKYRASVKRWLNEALGRVARQIDLPQTETSTTLSTVAGAQALALPATLVRVTSVLDADRRDYLTEVQPADVDESSSTPNRPSGYAIFGANLLLTPTPDAVYTLTLRYWTGATLMVNDADVPGLPFDYRDLLVSYAKSRAFAAEDDFEASQFWRAEYERDLVRARADLQHRSDRPVRQIQGMWN